MDIRAHEDRYAMCWFMLLWLSVLMCCVNRKVVMKRIFHDYLSVYHYRSALMI